MSNRASIGLSADQLAEFRRYKLQFQVQYELSNLSDADFLLKSARIVSKSIQQTQKGAVEDGN